MVFFSEGFENGGLKWKSFKKPARQAEGLTDPAVTLKALLRNEKCGGGS
jgi:hypothetical protein